MRFRGLLAATGVLAALAVLVWWSQRTKQNEPDKASTDTSKIVSIPEDQITRVEVKRAAGETTVLERKDGQWAITAPRPLRADQDAASSLVSSAASLSSDQVVFDKPPANLDEFGLKSPSVEVILTGKDGKQKIIEIGDEAPTGSSYFVRLAGDPRVFTIASYNKLALDKTGNDLRDKRLLTFDQNKLTRVELTAKGQTLEFGKNGRNEWQIVKPQPVRADGALVDELVRKLGDAKMDALAAGDDIKKAAQGFNAGAPAGVVRVTDAAGTQELVVHRGADKNYYAKSSVIEGVHKLDNDLGEMLVKGLDGYRNKKLFDFGWSEPSKVEVRDGGKTWVWSKAGQDWLAGAKKVDPSTVQAVIDELRNLSATKFPPGGFTTPSIDLSVTSEDGKRVERVQLSGAGKSWFAKRENEPSIYEVDASAIDSLRKAVTSVKEAPPEKK